MRKWMYPVLVALLLGCSEGAVPWHGHDISGLMPDLAFTLAYDTGRPVAAAAFSGKLVLLYFGFTHCEDVCPATLTTLSAALRRLGGDAGQVRVLFVSVDPRRDTPAVLRRYAGHFAPQIVGLSGSREQLQALSRRYRVAYSYGEPDRKGDYEVYHSSAIFAFDRSGRVRLLLQQQEGAAAIAADLRRLLGEAG